MARIRNTEAARQDLHGNVRWIPAALQTDFVQWSSMRRLVFLIAQGQC